MTSDNRKSTERAASKLFKFCFLKRIANEAALWNSNRPNSIWASQYEHLNLRFSNEISVEIPNFNQNFIKNFSARLPIYIDKLKNHNISSYRTQKSYHLSPFQTNSIIEEVSAKPANFFYFLLRSNWRVHSSNCPVNFIPLHWHLRFDISTFDIIKGFYSRRLGCIEFKIWNRLKFQRASSKKRLVGENAADAEELLSNHSVVSAQWVQLTKEHLQNFPKFECKWLPNSFDSSRTNEMLQLNRN